MSSPLSPAVKTVLEQEHLQRLATLCLGAAVSIIERGAQCIVAFWHQIALDLQLADYSRTEDSGQEVMAPENPGPCYTSRAFAITHLAMYDAYVGITGDDSTYLTYNDTEVPDTVQPGAVSLTWSQLRRCPQLYIAFLVCKQV